MKVLLIHTCGQEGSVALADSACDNPIRAEVSLPPRTSSESLMPAVKSLLQGAGWTAGELEAIGVVSGPGSFTGVRTGLSVGKGLSEALSIPLVGVSRLSLLARTVDEGGVHAVLDAGRAEFYYGSYLDGICQREAVLERGEFLRMIEPGATIIVCEEKVATELKERNPQLVPEPRAAQSLGLVLEGVARASGSAEANYLRQTDGEIFAKPPVGRVSPESPR